MSYGSPKILMKTRISILILSGIFLLGCSLSKNDSILNASEHPQPLISESQGQMLPIGAKAIIADQIIELEVAKTPQQQALGLMYRQELPDHRGMLFPFENPRPTRFWMKNVSIFLDMVFLRDGKVQYIAKNVPPCRETPCPTYGPDVLIDQVIELRGGRASELGINIGDPIKIEFLK